MKLEERRRNEERKRPKSLEGVWLIVIIKVSPEKRRHTASLPDSKSSSNNTPFTAAELETVLSQLCELPTHASVLGLQPYTSGQ